jgi:hypothetical protein
VTPHRSVMVGLALLAGAGAAPAVAGTVYDTRFEDVIRPKLIASGIRHVRDGVVTHAEAGPEFFYYRRCRALAEAGIRFDFLITFPAAGREGTDYDKVDDAFRWCGGAVDSFEGVNEPDLQALPDGRDWRTETVAAQEALHRAVRGSAAIRNVPVIGPSVVSSPQAVGDLSGLLHYGNWHPYPGGECPTCGDVYGQNLDTYLPAYRAPSGTKPMVMTETGYHNAVNMPFAEGLHRPASELAAAKYLPRLLLEYFNRGFVRTYLYELIDAAPDPAREHPDSNFGLLRNDGSEKPAYRAVRNLLGLLRDGDSGFTPDSLDYELGGDLASVHHTLLQKRDGRFFLALWLERSSYDTGARPNAPDDVAARRDLAVAEQPLSISLAKAPAAANLHRITESGALASEAATVRDRSIVVALTDRLTIVELEPERRSALGAPGAGNRRPRLSHLRLTRRVLRRGQGTRLRYRLSERASVSVAIVRRGRARPLRRLRAQRRAGRRSTFVPGRARGRALLAGRYRVRVRARDLLGARSAERVVGFRVLRRR